MIGRRAPPSRRAQDHIQLVLQLSLTDELGEAFGPQRNLDLVVTRGGGPENFVSHRETANDRSACFNSTAVSPSLGNSASVERISSGE